MFAIALEFKVLVCLENVDPENGLKSQCSDINDQVSSEMVR